MFENFHRSGKYKSRKVALNKYVRNSIAFLGRHLANSAIKAWRFLEGIFLYCSF